MSSKLFSEVWMKNIQRFFYIIYLIFFRDIVCGILFIRSQIRLRWFAWRKIVLVDLFDNNVKRFPNKPAIIYNKKKYSYKDVWILSNKVANWLESGLKLYRDEEYENRFQKLDPQPNEKTARKIRRHHQSIRIGLMFDNVPELASFMIGINRVRCSASVFNTNHRKELLVNAFNASQCKAFIFESRFLPAIQEVASKLDENIKFFMFDRQLLYNHKELSKESDSQAYIHYKGLSSKDLSTLGELDERSKQFAKILNECPPTPVQKKYPHRIDDIVLYLFTSGTTGGNVKAAAITNFRYLTACIMENIVFGMKSTDNIYVCVPVYHAMGGMMGIGASLIIGATSTLADKFSASNYWKDCYENGCTVALYIGEICRYLMAKPSHEYEQKHQIRLMIGPGLKDKDVWIKFKKRFNIGRIVEFYGSTEGNANIFNYFGVPGACGFLPYYLGPIYRFIYPSYLIKVHPETFELVRDKNGLCQFCQPGDIGMLLGGIREGDPYTEFLGYTSTQESNKKIINNILKKGDYAFLTGDLFEMDYYGNLFFKDRTGDTFRWKGENVSTAEIENVVAQFLNQRDACVYGVCIPNTDGRAGMMATTEQEINLEEFYQFMKSQCPDYAQPKFIRITDHIEKTGTMKYVKKTLREDGYDLNKMKPEDRLYYFDRLTKKYLPLTTEAYEKIQNGILTF